MTAGGHIRLLPPDVANKIAAGEVVERPASVLKELIENALDAGATQIDVEVVAGGSRLIAVADNGGGMNRDDALLSIERHATSKIRTAADIERIQTLGFRGEALAAISAVSRFRVRTRRPEDLAGTELTVSGGTLQDVRESGCPSGTAVEVRDLFFNMPARRKFLRAPPTELSHLRQVFVVQALAHPEIGMKLVVDGRCAYTVAGGARLEDRLRELFGAEWRVEEFRAVRSASDDGLTIHGYVSLPSLTRGDRYEQYVFVNRRPATAPLLIHAIGEGYHTLLPHDRHPHVVLFLDMDPALVDVNVHPAKKEVRFRHPTDVRDALIAAIREALMSGTKAQGPGLAEATASAGPPPAGLPGEPPTLRIDDLPPTRIFKYPRMPMMGLSDPASPEASRKDGGAASPALAALPVSTDADAAAASPAGREPSAPDGASRVRTPWAWCRVVGQIGGLYVLLETEDGYVIMDPHAAHERVLFEKFMNGVISGRIESQGLLVPQTVELLPRDALRVRENLNVLKNMGFGVSEFGGDAFVVDALPVHFAGVAARPLLLDVAQSLETTGGRGGHQARLREEAIAQAACKAAVKARDRLTLPEIEKLVVDLASTEMPYTCPHGRPTLIYSSFKELARKFGRE
jgi:DNA mismatch repair protein MutL